MNVIFLSSKIISKEYKIMMKIEKIKKNVICSLTYLTKKRKKSIFYYLLTCMYQKRRIVTEVGISSSGILISAQVL